MVSPLSVIVLLTLALLLVALLVILVARSAHGVDLRVALAMCLGLAALVACLVVATLYFQSTEAGAPPAPTAIATTTFPAEAVPGMTSVATATFPAVPPPHISGAFAHFQARRPLLAMVVGMAAVVFLAYAMLRRAARRHDVRSSAERSPRR